MAGSGIDGSGGLGLGPTPAPVRGEPQPAGAPAHSAEADEARPAVRVNEAAAVAAPAPAPVSGNQAAPGKDRDAANEPTAPRGDAANDAKRGEQMAIDAETMTRLAQTRARDSQQAAQALGLNGIEPNVERKEAQQLEGEAEAKRSAWLKKGQDAQAQTPAPAQAQEAGRNKLDSDEVFTATPQEVKPVIPPEVEKAYLRVGDKFYHPKNTDAVAFEDKGNRLETQSNSERIAESMVQIAQARGWDEIKVSGTETFRQEVWLEAAARGMHVKGYTPTDQDRAELAKRTQEAGRNKLEQDGDAVRARENAAKPAAEASKSTEAAAPAAAATPAAPPAAAAEKPTGPNHDRAEAFANKPAAVALAAHPELAGAYGVQAAIDKQAEADGLTPQQRAVVQARVKANITNAIERGELPAIEVREQREVQRERTQDKEREASR